MRLFTERNLTIFLAGGILGGIALGLFARTTASPFLVGLVENSAILGTLFLSMLKMIVTPLVLFSVTSGVANLGGGKEVGRKLAKTLVYFALTSFLAVFIGIVYTNVIRPGSGTTAEAMRARLPESAVMAAQGTQEKVALNAPASFMEFVQVQIGNVFMNPFKALAEMNLIGVVTFGMMLGVVLMLLGDRGRPARDFFTSMNDALLNLVQVVIWVAPPGLFALAAGLMYNLGPEVIRPLSRYFLTVVAGLLTQGFLVYPLILLVLCRYSPMRFFLGIKEAMLLAVSCASSSATLPVTMRVVEEHCGVDKRSANFVLPMGATINMDGTALYEAVAAMFVAQLLGIELGLQQQIIVFFTATLAAVGAAGIPQAGLVTMVIVFNAIGIPLEWMALIIVVDRPLDHLRTMINITGDAVGSVYLSHSEGELDKPAPAADFAR